MPASVPPGYTRGPLLFWGASTDPTIDLSLRQWLWREAGGYGARLVLITVEARYAAALTALSAEFSSWECDHIDEIVALDRNTARNPLLAAPVDRSTGVVIWGEEPLRLAALLGGTPLAQAIRRANARSKVVAGMGAAGAFLCQHLISPGLQPATLWGQVTFGPGLGLVNRLVVDATSVERELPPAHHNRLLAAVASNPYLIGVGLASGSAAILYPDNTLQSNGPSPVTIIDGQEIDAVDFDATDAVADLNPRSTKGNGITGALHYTLHMGDGFNLDDHSLRPAGEIDLPTIGPVTSVF
jgi:cyanophycinase